MIINCEGESQAKANGDDDEADHQQLNMINCFCVIHSLPLSRSLYLSQFVLICGTGFIVPAFCRRQSVDMCALLGWWCTILATL